MPDLQMSALIVKEPLTPQLHAEDKQAEQLCESSTEDIEPKVYLKSISQVGESVFPECTMFVCAVDLAIHFP